MPNRGCGKRVEGGLYACCDASPWGRPIEDFLVDPAQPIETEPFRAPQFVGSDLLMWVGEEFYPTVPDFVEEAQVWGVSRRLPDNFPIDKIAHGCKMFMVHRNAMISYSQYTSLIEKLPSLECPKKLEHHEHPTATNLQRCLGSLWPLASLKGGRTWPANTLDDCRMIMRFCGDTQYAVFDLNDVVSPDWPNYEVGIFAAFPITSFQYVSKEHQVPAEIADKANPDEIPLMVVDE